MIYANVKSLLKRQQPISLEPQASVQESAELMAEHRVGAIPIIGSGRLCGIFTERDLLNRVVSKGLRPNKLCVEEVMTKHPITVDANTSLVNSLTIMFKHGFRHLPVLENERVIGVLSCRDIPAEYWLMQENWATAQHELKVRSG